MSDLTSFFKTAGASLRMPAQWEPHQATWMAWPFDEDQWWQQLDAARAEYAALVTFIAQGETVHLLCADDESLISAQASLYQPVQQGRVVLHQLPLNDVWTRDSGGIFVHDHLGKQHILKWEFNAWGEKYPYEKDNQVGFFMAQKSNTPCVQPGVVLEGGSVEVNGQGLGLTTASCLLSPKRNPHLKQDELTSLVQRCFGISHLGWLPRGLVGDHTDGHIDTLARFVNPRTIVFNSCAARTSIATPADPNEELMKENKEALFDWTRTLPTEIQPQLVALPLPSRALFCAGERLPANYANFYFCNAALLVPQFGDENDRLAIDILRQFVADRPVVGVPARILLTGGGILNCLTQQQPVTQLV